MSENANNRSKPAQTLPGQQGPIQILGNLGNLMRSGPLEQYKIKDKNIDQDGEYGVLGMLLYMQPHWEGIFAEDVGLMDTIYPTSNQTVKQLLD